MMKVLGVAYPWPLSTQVVEDSENWKPVFQEGEFSRRLQSSWLVLPLRIAVLLGGIFRPRPWRNSYEAFKLGFDRWKKLSQPQTLHPLMGNVELEDVMAESANEINDELSSAAKNGYIQF